MRSTPLQDRSAKRIETFLDSASEIIGEVGFEELTMTEIAERSDASIGSLYRWFPDKESVGAELRKRYRVQLQAVFAKLADDSDGMTVTEFSHTLIDRIVEFNEANPAFLILAESTSRPPPDREANRSLREQFAASFQVMQPSLPMERAYLIANVAIEIVKGLINSFRRSVEVDRQAMAAEFKFALDLYLEKALAIN